MEKGEIQDVEEKLEKRKGSKSKIHCYILVIIYIVDTCY